MDLKLILVDKINQKETRPRYSIPQPLFTPENLVQFIDGPQAVHGKSIKIQLLVKASVYPVLSQDHGTCQFIFCVTFSDSFQCPFNVSQQFFQHHVVLRRNLPSAHIGADLLHLRNQLGIDRQQLGKNFFSSGFKCFSV